MPVLVLMDQLTCLPDPLTPSKGFSWRRAVMPWRAATLRSVSMTKLVRIGGDVGLGKDAGDLELVGRDFVVLCF